MPHRCAGCKTLFPDARHLRDGCPVCGSGKFVYENGRRSTPAETPPKPTSKTPEPEIEGKKVQTDCEKETQNQDFDSIESIRILEPGRYDLNLSRLAESDDRVVRMGTEDSYRLDLHSMIRRKKKK